MLRSLGFLYPTGTLAFVVKQLVVWLKHLCTHVFPAKRDEPIALDDSQVCLVFAQFHVGSLKSLGLTQHAIAELIGCYALL